MDSRQMEHKVNLACVRIPSTTSKSPATRSNKQEPAETSNHREMWRERGRERSLHHGAHQTSTAVPMSLHHVGFQFRIFFLWARQCCARGNVTKLRRCPSEPCRNWGNSRPEAPELVLGECPRCSTLVYGLDMSVDIEGFFKQNMKRKRELEDWKPRFARFDGASFLGICLT